MNAENQHGDLLKLTADEFEEFTRRLDRLRDRGVYYFKGAGMELSLTPKTVTYGSPVVDSSADTEKTIDQKLFGV